MDHEQSLAFNMDFAEARLIEQGEVLPMAVIETGDGQRHVIAMDLHDDAAKERSFKFTRLLCVAHEAVSLTIIGEMWMRMMAPYDGESEADYMERVEAVRPRDAEDRKEVVMVQLYVREDGSVREFSDTREILRDATGKPTGLAQRPEWDVLESTGEQTEILPRTPPLPEQVRYARELLTRFGITGSRI
jgi:hypothetical protein